MDTRENTQIISLLSGKGGSGKTSIAIGISHILNSMGFKVLLIDLDFATNGASYFFRYLYENSNKLGSYELLCQLNADKILSNAKTFNLDKVDFIYEIKEGLNFIPSRINYLKKLPLIGETIFDEAGLKCFIESLIKSSQGEYSFIIFDNQAGSNITSKMSSKLSDKAIIVSELDPISSDMIDALIIQLGNNLPSYKRYLINKLDIRESEDYKNLSSLFQSMNRLPPLPFDFDVRAAFSSREVPIYIERPTTFHIALFNTVKAFIPEYKQYLDKYGDKIIEKFNLYQKKIDTLLDRKRKIESIETEILKKAKRRIEYSRTALLVAFIMTITIFITYFVSKRGIEHIAIELFDKINIPVLGVLTGILITIIITIIIMITNLSDFIGKDVKLSEEDNKELDRIKKALESFDSLKLTKSKEFLSLFIKNSIP